jgi:ABC-type glycerol-3-phosphate transport system permease component
LSSPTSLSSLFHNVIRSNFRSRKELVDYNVIAALVVAFVVVVVLFLFFVTGSMTGGTMNARKMEADG